MKLAQKYNRINIAVTILIFIAGSVSFYFILSYILLQQLDNTLTTEQQEIIQYAREHKYFPEVLQANDQSVVYSELQGPIAFSGFRSVKIDDPKNDKHEHRRELIFSINIAQKDYQVVVSKSQVETEELLRLIILVTFVMIALILLAAYLINRTVLRRLWQPFYQSIEEIKKYDLSTNTKLTLATTDIDEFSLLNNSVSNMTDRVQHDYTILKEFTGNAAHEMQTPLAVIRSKLEVLMQNETVLKENIQPVIEIEQFVNKLTRLNQSLLLLTKIENNSFKLNENVQFDIILIQKLIELSDIIEASAIRITTTIEPVEIKFHVLLAEVLISNLLNNAIRYNYEGGEINITLNQASFIISNTSLVGKLNQQMVFQRFYRHENTVKEGNGLGLSIVKQICELAGLKYNYAFIDNQHVFHISFS
ncbi:sensor histidine kinase [Solitalea canadensis]|uniref:histidine kinase n=1 Tax=Solitalea canadensis (strain ATCC 29591 / DSM 3403 / JCM 21819 / LMG 8368 / NBRC 15130 / NCIMB 12057 / USAM 9D) TaxID=929556 RepID=H8KVB2_SOLCM|nr:ATP-binding protein [Solitalea canadensis]AFD06170.1 signal transduction histidine kinase [Solitalea canadensis DSM 3403]